MEHGTPFPHYQLSQSNSGLNLNQHNNNPDPTLTSNANPNKSTAQVLPQTSTVREQDQYMPIANVIRIMRRILPMNAKVSDDAKHAIQECVSEYISFVTSEANERCQREQRRTITADDIIYAMGKLGLDDYVGPLELFINRYREFKSDHGSSLRGESSSFKPVYVGNNVGFNASICVPHHGPIHGPTHDPIHGPVHGPSHGATHGPPPPGHYGYDMLDQSMVISGGRYYRNGPDQDGSSGSGSGSHAPSMNGMPIFDQYGNQYK